MVRGSQNSLNRPSLDMGQNKDRPMSAYMMPQGQQMYPPHSMAQQQQQSHPPRSQSSRDIIRQEAKLQEMQEEVRRRELRGNPVTGGYRPATYNARPILQQNSVRPVRPLGSTPNLGPTSANYRHLGPTYGYVDMQFRQQPPMNNAYIMANRPYGQNGPQHYTNGPESTMVGGIHYHGQGQVDIDGNELPPVRPMLPQAGHSPTPPPPNALTHPLYNKGTDNAAR